MNIGIFEKLHFTSDIIIPKNAKNYKKAKHRNLKITNNNRTVAQIYCHIAYSIQPKSNDKCHFILQQQQWQFVWGNIQCSHFLLIFGLIIYVYVGQNKYCEFLAQQQPHSSVVAHLFTHMFQKNKKRPSQATV